ncbi:MAG: hypothetical protein ACYDEN_07190 [Acidimicrobiales bacterium]
MPVDLAATAAARLPSRFVDRESLESAPGAGTTVTVILPLRLP